MKGMMGIHGMVGGMTRTFGLQNHFGKPDDESMRAKNPVDWRRALRYFKPYLIQWFGILVCIIVSAGLSVLPPLFVRTILDEAIPNSETALLAMLAASMVGIAVASGLIGVLQQTTTARTGQSIMFDIRNQLFGHLQKMSLNFYTRTRSGDIVSRLNNDVNAVQGVATGTLISIASNVITLMVTSIALLSMNWRLALVAVFVVPAFYLPSLIVGRIRRKLSAQTQEAQANLLVFMQERLNVGGVLLTNIFGQIQNDKKQFSDGSDAVRQLNVRQAVVGRWLFMVLSVFSAVGPAVVYWYGGLQVLKDSLTPGLLIAFAALLAQLYRPLMQLATVYVDIQASMAVFERIFEYLDTKPDVEDAAQPVVLERIDGRIAFENVSFMYPAPAPSASASAPVPATDVEKLPFSLEGISFEIAPGEQVALVGPSGSGKTTLTYLVPRFYDPSAGRMTLDGVDLRDIEQTSLRRHIGMVTQETFMFHATIKENLKYAKTDASDAEIIDACRAANIHDFISELPEGYDTVVGERGFRLSGGEKQRLSIARALLKNPSILILDEATSSLDATSEYLIHEALEKLLKNRTSLIIAHRLSTILSSDRIVVVENGRMKEIGTHQELLRAGGLYASLFNKQFSKALESRLELAPDAVLAGALQAGNA
ncbi:MAG: ABC transporter ATP-binding protein [Planctomycetota bacterium]